MWRRMHLMHLCVTRAELAFAIALLVIASPASAGAVLQVGPQHELKTPSAAAKVAHDGDTVQIEPGLYAGDVAVWFQNRLTIRAVGGRAQLRADGGHAEGKAIWVIKGAHTTIENIEFSGAKVPDRNGAAIRLEGPGLAIRNCYVHHNENGILTTQNLESDILIEHSEFAYNGFGNGQTHNIYIGNVRSFTLKSSYVHHALVGHNVKSRAVKSYIAYNRIMDEMDGRSSYAIDLPNGGLSFVIGNLVQQGPANDNRTVVAYGAEGYKNALNKLYFVNNTVVNDDPRGGRFFSIRPGADAVRVMNNVFSGPGELGVENGELRTNQRLASNDFVAAGKFDYRLKPGSRAVGQGVEAGSAYGVSLRPSAEYQHPLQTRARSTSGSLDLGALQHRR
jgi:hypothetical protein